jgi:hypothetical protein
LVSEIFFTFRCDSTGNKPQTVQASSSSRHRSGSTGNRVKTVNKNYDNYYRGGSAGTAGSQASSVSSGAGSYNAHKAIMARTAALNPNNKVQTAATVRSKDPDAAKENSGKSS